MRTAASSPKGPLSERVAQELQYPVEEGLCPLIDTPINNSTNDDDTATHFIDISL